MSGIAAEHQDRPIEAADVSESEVDENSDADSALGQSSTASVASSIFEYRKFKGRSYHAARHESEYFVPTDDLTLENFDIMHHFLTLLLDGKLQLAPIQHDVQGDVVTGTQNPANTNLGIWAITTTLETPTPNTPASDFADEHPNTEVIGTDLSPVQPPWVPPNLKFEIDDCTQPWTWAEGTFDFVHIRYLFGAIRDWTALYKEAYRALKPGAWVQSCESEPTTVSDDGTVADDGKTALGGTWGKMFVEGGKVTGMSLSVVSEGLQRKAVEEAGFVDVHEVTYKVPFGSWPKDAKLAEIGQFAKLSLESDLVGYTQLMWHEVLKWPQDEYQVFLMQVRKDLKNKNLHPYFRVRYVWGRKPEEAVA